MKRFFLIFSVMGLAAFALSGCGAVMQSQIIKVKLEPLPAAYAKGGLVPKDFENPAPRPQELILFWSQDLVNLVPDSESGWTYNRSAFLVFGVGPANHENSWHNYVRLNLPRNSCFIAAGRTINIYGKGPPYYIPFCTGSDPYAVRYTMVVPGYPPADASALPVLLQDRPITPIGPGPLNLQKTIDLTSVGSVTADWLTNKIFYGR